MNLSQYAKNAGVGCRTAWNRYKVGKMSGAWQDEHGIVHVPEPGAELLPKATNHARVCSPEQHDDLERQVQRLTGFCPRPRPSGGLRYQVASGVNDRRPKLIKLLQSEGRGTLVMEQRDRLTGVRVNWFEVFLTQQGKRIEVASGAQERTSDLMDDFLSLIYSFTARLYGLRGSRNRSRRLIDALEREAGA